MQLYCELSSQNILNFWQRRYSRSCIRVFPQITKQPRTARLHRQPLGSDILTSRSKVRSYGPGTVNPDVQHILRPTCLRFLSSVRDQLLASTAEVFDTDLEGTWHDQQYIGEVALRTVQTIAKPISPAKASAVLYQFFCYVIGKLTLEATGLSSIQPSRHPTTRRRCN